MKTYSPIKADDGFTLVELMITLIITSVISATLYSAYIYQQRSQTAQDQVVDMQQNIRSVLYFVAREIRMAGFDPQNISGAGILKATKGRFQFSQDINNNGPGVTPGDGDLLDPSETITFGFSSINDPGFDGIADAGAAPLGRDTGGGFQPVADNIQAIEFFYTMESGAKTLTPDPAQFDDIRMITISILARAGVADNHYHNKQDYITASGATWSVNDNFRRRLLITDLQLKNMGL